METRNTHKRLRMPIRTGMSPVRALTRITCGWMASRREAANRVVAAFLAVAMLVSSLPVCASPQAPPVDKTVQKGRRVSAPGRPVIHHKGATTTHPDSISPGASAMLPDSIGLGAPVVVPAEVVEDEITDRDGHIDLMPVDTVDVEIGQIAANDSIAALLASAPAREDEWEPRAVEFNPDPTRAVWMSALFPGLGQLYNRRYWKLPIIVGGYLGLAYATNWNNNMLRDYTRAYADLLDNDPNTRSYMNMFSPNVKEENVDRGWLQNVLKSRKNYFRRNRDLCIICMVGVYLLAMVDAYVDASLSHFDISPDLSMDVAPAMLRDGRQRYPSVGLVWALNF